MTDIGELEGITSDEAAKLRRAGIGTVKKFEGQIEHDFIAGIKLMVSQTGIKPDRLMELLPPDRLVVESVPEAWLEGLTRRILRKAPQDDPWIRRCRFSVERFARCLKGNWLGREKNLPIFVLAAWLLMLVALTLRAVGFFQGLPEPLGLRDQALVAADNLESERVLRQGDFYPALLPFENDYFRPGDKLEGLILARSVSGQKPLRFQDVLRRQVIATKELQTDAIIQKEDVTLAWTVYQPGAALTTEEVCGRKTTHPIRKDGAVLSAFIRPVE
jgi:hypothetical protein